ncbi:MAG TPA: diguanylate cyclase [Kineosporiaceae bacterium]|nr:diguanylate cyclase [Kineosporiaceae bacterium]
MLVVDDDFGSRLVAQATVDRLNHECVVGVDGDEGWRLFNEVAPDVVVTDRSMPGLDGLELCRRIRAAKTDRYTYIILVTGLSDPAEVIKGMHAGADDYIGKPLDPLHLEARLLGARRVTELHAELATARQALSHQAHTDALTGLPNRLALTQDLEQIHRHSERYGRSYCLAMCDVDFFKRYNDTYGHLAGDEALRQVARTLQGGLRDGDRVYRFGGEEFLIVLPEQTTPQALIPMERSLHQLSCLALEHRTGGPTGVITLSVGLTSFGAGNPVTSQALLADADRALYRAKSAGRNCVVCAGF